MGARCTPGIFVTGTDTGVGKSLVSAALIRVVGSHGRRTIGLKPVASGARWTPSGFCNDDALLLNATSTVRIPLELTNPYCFEPAIAPHLAAAEAGVTVTAEELEAWYERASAGADIAVVEGAGGWRTPLHPSGYLSHARLTFEAIQASRSCRFAGWVGNRIDRGFERLDANLASLERLLGCAPLAVIPPLAEASVAEVAALLDRPEVLVAVGCPD